MPFTFKQSYASAYLGEQEKLMSKLLELSEKEVAQEAAVLKARREAAINQMKQIDDRIFKLRDGIIDTSYQNKVDRAKFNLDIDKFNTGSVTSSVTDRVGGGGGDGDDDGFKVYQPDGKMYTFDGKQVLSPLADALAKGDTVANAIGATDATKYLTETKQEDDVNQLNANAAGIMATLAWKGKYGEGFTEQKAIKAVANLKEYLIKEYPDIYTPESLDQAFKKVPKSVNPENPTGVAGVKFSRSKTQSYTGPSEKIDVEFPQYDPAAERAEIEALMAQRAQLQSGMDALGGPPDAMQLMAQKFRRYAPINEPLEGREASVQSKALSRGFARALDMVQNNRDSSSLFRGTAVEGIDRNALKVETQGKTESQIIDEVVEKVEAMGVPEDQKEQVAQDILTVSLVEGVQKQKTGTLTAPGKQMLEKEEITPDPVAPAAYNWATVQNQFAADTASGGMYTDGAGIYRERGTGPVFERRQRMGYEPGEGPPGPWASAKPIFPIFKEGSAVDELIKSGQDVDVYGNFQRGVAKTNEDVLAAARQISNVPDYLQRGVAKTEEDFAKLFLERLEP